MSAIASQSSKGAEALSTMLSSVDLGLVFSELVDRGVTEDAAMKWISNTTSELASLITAKGWNKQEFCAAVERRVKKRIEERAKRDADAGRAQGQTRLSRVRSSEK